MIKIKVLKKDEIIKSVTTKGHANFAEYGKDIVCAGVSAIMVGGLNSIIEMTGVTPKYSMNEGYLSLEVAADELTQQIVRVMLIQLKSIQESYPKNVHIEM
jgi:uncharacterized protein YsxB (DUF464 family)